VDGQLSAIVQDLQAVEQRLRQLHSWLPHDAWSQAPAPGRWSPAECVAHLNLTSSAMLPLRHEGLRKASRSPIGPPSRYRRDIVGWVIWKLIAPANRWRTRTIRAFVPSGEESPDTVMAEFSRLQSEVIACVRAADGLPVDHVTVRSPFDGRVTYNLYSALTLIPRHQERHAVQAERASSVRVAEPSPLAV
jgi:hypothetical protein